MYSTDVHVFYNLGSWGRLRCLKQKFLAIAQLVVIKNEHLSSIPIHKILYILIGIDHCFRIQLGWTKNPPLHIVVK